MSRQIKWRVKFKSLQGTDCTVNIYRENYTGSIIDLIGAADPFEYEENNSDDLLNVVRAKTGYIRVVEQNYGDLNDLYPTSETSRFVEFYYGTRLDFVGYMQAQSFENSWTATPRVLEFPIQSPLNMLGGMFFNVINPPGDRTLGALLAEVTEKLSADDDNIYTDVIYPDTTPSFDSKINTLIVSPFNSDFEEVGGTAANLFNSSDMLSFVEGICNAFGWMLHEEPGKLIFSRFDYTGNYARCDIDNLYNATAMKTVISGYTGGTVMDLDSYYTIAGDEHTHKIDRPISSLEWQYDGQVIDSASMDDLHAAYVGQSVTDYGGVAAWLRTVGPELGGSKLLNANTVDGGVLATPGINLCYAGADHMEDDEGNSLAAVRKRFLIYRGSENWVANTELFYINFYEHPSDMCKLEIDMSWGSRVEYLGSKTGDDEGTDATRYRFALVIECGGKYFNNNGTNDPWQSSIAYVDFDVPVKRGSGDMIIRNVPRRGPLKISFRWSNLPGPYGVEWGRLASIDDIRLSQVNSVLSQYSNPNLSYDKKEHSTGSPETASVGMVMNCYKNSNRLIGDSIYATKFTEYDYLFSPRNILSVLMKESARPLQFYASKWKFWIDSWRWRITSVSFYPWDDNYKIKIHQSSTLE